MRNLICNIDQRALVSESVYLRDPENNGIEIYRDRPTIEWPLDNE